MNPTKMVGNENIPRETVQNGFKHLDAEQSFSNKATTRQSIVNQANVTTSSSSSSTTDPSTITSSYFLTLLVSELQNQDPTAPTDPNAYITQLVGVNSLQQLISINEGITALDPTTS